MASSAAKLFVEIDGTATGFSKALTDVENRVAGVGKKMQNIGQGITSAGKNLTAAVTLPIVAGAVAATKAAIDWESAWTGVLKTVDATPEQLKAIELGLRQMSKEIPSSAEDLAGIAEIGGQLGIDPGNLLKFTRVIADLQETTNVQGEEGALALAQLLNVMGTSQGDIDRVGATIVALGNNTATTEADIISMAQRLAAAGAIVGLTESDVLSLAAGMSSVGINAEAGGSAMSKVFIDIANAVAGSSGSVVDNTAKIEAQQKKIRRLNDSIAETKAKMGEWTDETKESTKLIQRNNLAQYEQDLIDAQAAVDALAAANGTVSDPGKLALLAQTSGLSTAEFSVLFDETPAEAIQKFVQGLGKLDKAGKIQVLEGLDFDTIRIQNMLLSLANAEQESGLLADALNLGAKAWDENSALAAEAALRYGTTESKLKLLRNRFEDVLRTVGGPLVDALIAALNAAEPFFRFIEKIATAFANADPATQQMVLAIAGIAAAAGPALIVIGSLITAVGGLISLFASPVAVPILAAIAAIAAFGVGQLGGWEGVKTLVSEAFGSIGNTGKSAQDRLTAFLGEFSQMGGTMAEQQIKWNATSEAMRRKWGEDWLENSKAVDEFITLLGGNVTTATTQLDTVKSNWTSNVSEISAASSTAATDIQTAWASLSTTWATLFGSDGKSGTMGAPFKGWGDFVAQVIREVGGSIANLLKFIELMARAAVNLKNLVTFQIGFNEFRAIKAQIDREANALGSARQAPIDPETQALLNFMNGGTGVSDGQFAGASPTARSGQLVQNNSINAPLIGSVTVRNEADMNRIQRFITDELEAALNVSIDSGTRALVGAR